jgi:hypothetical protein
MTVSEAKALLKKRQDGEVLTASESNLLKIALEVILKSVFTS